MLEDNLQSFASPLQRPDGLHRHETLDVQLGSPVVTAFKEVASEKTRRTMLSGTEATHHHQSLDDIVDSKSVTSYATTVRDITGKGIDLPPPPRAADGDKDFECPYCFIICPARYGKGRPWRTHMLQDLQPYICTYSDCKTPEQLFRSRREWSDHESTHRKAWRCPEHPSAVFRSREGLSQHLCQVHADSFPEHQLDSIVKVGGTSTVDVRESCPICLVPADIVEGGLQNHIANHLERIASFSLPSSAAGDGSDGGSSAASRGGSATTGSSQDLGDGDSELSFGSESIEDKNDKSGQDSTDTQASLIAPISSRDQEVPGRHSLLSADSVGNLPDSSQNRLNILMASQPPIETDDEASFEKDLAANAQFPPDGEEHLAAMGPFRQYITSIPGFISYRVLPRSQWWRGYINFDSITSAAQALESFDYAQFPTTKIRQAPENASTLKFNLPMVDQSIQAPPQQKMLDNADLSSSIESDSEEELYSKAEKPRLDIPESQRPVLQLSEVPNLRALYGSRKLLQRDQSYAPHVAYNQIVSLCLYDITRLQVECIVNSANRSMSTRNGDSFSRYVHNSAGPELQEECKKFTHVTEGEARLTSGHDLPAKYIIHVARPQYSVSQRKALSKTNALTECYRNALKMAMVQGIKTVAFPCVGTGGCGWPSRAAARIALQEVRVFLDSYKSHPFERIVFCVYNAMDQKSYEELLPVFFPPTHRDLERAAMGDQSRDANSLALQLRDTFLQVESISIELVSFRDNVAEFPPSVLSDLAAIMMALSTLRTHFSSTGATLANLTTRAVSDLDLSCAVLQNACGSLGEIVEQAKATGSSIKRTHEVIWTEYNSHLTEYQGLNVQSLIELCRDFTQCLSGALTG